MRMLIVSFSTFFSQAKGVIDADGEQSLTGYESSTVQLPIEATEKYPENYANHDSMHRNFLWFNFYGSFFIFQYFLLQLMFNSTRNKINVEHERLQKNAMESRYQVHKFKVENAQDEITFS